MSLIRFEIRYVDGRKDIANVDGERALIGHGAHCDVRLPLDQAADEHVAVEVVGGTVRVETKAFDPPATVNGLPFTTMPIGPDTPLQLGTTRVFISLGDFGFERCPVVARKKKEQISPRTKLFALVGLAAAGYVLMSADEPRMAQAPVQAPDLFGGPVASCPQAAPNQARAIAVDKLGNRGGQAGAQSVRRQGRRSGGLPRTKPQRPAFVRPAMPSAPASGPRRRPAARVHRGGFSRAPNSARASDGHRRLRPRQRGREGPPIAHRGKAGRLGELAGARRSVESNRRRVARNRRSAASRFSPSLSCPPPGAHNPPSEGQAPTWRSFARKQVRRICRAAATPPRWQAT